jgi:glycosyltransferase involved in cell wall biosynthesis
MGKRVLVSVISDLVTDQRVHKVCQTLQENGFDVYLIGAKKRNSLPLSSRIYHAGRIRMLFQKKFPFYAEFNIRLFFRLIFRRVDIYLGNDLDALPATWLASRIRGKPIVYDTHEYFLEMAGVEGKPMIRKIWKNIESLIFPQVKYIYTICDSFRDLYKDVYHKKLYTVRNVPYLHVKDSGAYPGLLLEIDRLIPRNKRLMIFQGAGINPHRGAEELVQAMSRLDPRIYHLLLVGGGEIFSELEARIKKEKLEDRITVIPKVPFEVLRHITRQAQLGLSLDKPDNFNHRFGLPNKIFDYIHAGLPILCSRLVEVEKIVNTYQVGTFIENHEPGHIASCIEMVFGNEDQMKIWKANTENAKLALNWESESKIVLDIFEQVESKRVN